MLKGIRFHIYCFLTSADAYEIASMLREKEMNSTVGDKLGVKTWDCGDADVEFIVDQERARNKNLMK